MAFTVAQLNALEAAIGTGELTVSFEGRTVTYRSMSELMKARDTVRAELQASGALAADTTPRRSYARFDKR
jgi:hypothetical protein